MNNCNLKIFFEFEEIQNSYMTVTAKYHSTITVIEPITDKLCCYEQTIQMPSIVELTFTGKIDNQDTVVDVDGNIVKDKHVLIKEILLDELPVEPLFLQRRLKLEFNGQSNYSNYVGFNGKMLLEFDKSDVFRQLMIWQHLGEN